MIEAAGAFVEWMRGLPPLGIYAILFVVSWGENVVPPVPGDLVVVVAGSFAALGILALGPTFVVATSGSLLGFLTVYAVGRRLGEAVHDPNRMRWIPRGPIRMADVWLSKWGLGVVAANRFLSGGRAVIGLLVGSSRLPIGPVTFWAAVSAALWNVVLVGGGYAVGTEWERVVALLQQYGRVVTALVAIAVAAFFVRRYVRRRSRRAASEAK